MIEVLVAFAVLSFGLLGLAGLQARSLQNNHSAYLRTIATLQASDMADRLRANRAGWLQGDYDALSGAGNDNGCRAVHFADTHSNPANCSPANIAQDDLFDWQSANAARLPNGSGTVSAIAGSPGLFSVSLSWSENSGAGAVTHTFSTQVAP